MKGTQTILLSRMLARSWPRLDSLLDHNSTTKATSKEVDEILAHSNNGD